MLPIQFSLRWLFAASMVVAMLLGSFRIYGTRGVALVVTGVGITLLCQGYRRAGHWMLGLVAATVLLDSMLVANWSGSVPIWGNVVVVDATTRRPIPGAVLYVHQQHQLDPRYVNEYVQSESGIIFQRVIKGQHDALTDASGSGPYKFHLPCGGERSELGIFEPQREARFPLDRFELWVVKPGYQTRRLPLAILADSPPDILTWLVARAQHHRGNASA